MNLKETQLSSEPIFDGKFVTIARDTVRLPNGNQGYRIVIRHPGAACVLAVTEAGEVVLVRQWRYASGQALLELPAGKLDPGEPPLHCARRELREETGVTAKPGKLLFIQQFPSSRAGYEEELAFFFAVDNPDDFTDIDISQTTHGAQELAVCEYIDPSRHVLYPEFLQSTDIALYINGDQPVLVVDNFDEQHQQLL